MTDARIARVMQGFADAFPDNANHPFLAVAPGRTELLGNHTDHQQGMVLCAAVNLTMLACVASNGENRIRIVSEGFEPIEVSLEDLSPRRTDVGTSSGLVRGVAAAIAQRGYAVKGFDAYISSDVTSGSGLSSSAAYEILVGTILNHICQCNLDPSELAQIGQWAENRYFGKPCGLMDQMACSVGGAVFIDFAGGKAPVWERVEFDFASHGYGLCIVNTNSGHEDLTEAYAAIPREMSEVAAWFGKSVLGEVSEELFFDHLPQVRAACGDRAFLRTMHFFGENRRIPLAVKALKTGDLEEYFRLVDSSGRSSELLLQNIWAHPEQQAVTLGLALARRALGGKGAVRVHGGGFAGTIQAFVPLDGLADFVAQMDAFFGKGSCYILQIRPNGGEIIQM